MKLKTTLEESEKSAIVYKFSCKSSPAHYIGETEKKLATKLHVHECAIRRQEADYRFNFPEVTVITGQQPRYARCGFKKTFQSATK